MSEQIEVLNRSKQKLEKEKSELKLEVAELNTNVDALTKGKLNYEKQSRNLEDAIAELRQKYEENNVTIAVMVSALFLRIILNFQQINLKSLLKCLKLV